MDASPAAAFFVPAGQIAFLAGRRLESVGSDGSWQSLIEQTASLMKSQRLIPISFVTEGLKAQA